MLFPDIPDLCQRLRRQGRHVTLETAGTLWRDIHCDLVSLSPKLANSTPTGTAHATAHEANRLNLDALQQFIDRSEDRQLKFVVTQPEDLKEITALLGQLQNWTPADVLLMPEGIDPATLDQRALWLVDLCKQHGFRFCPRLHVHLYGHRSGV